MAREPQRREQPAQLSAAIVPLERALLARAKAIEAKAQGEPEDGDATLTGAFYGQLAAEFRALAEELHHW
jgi:hypothetical protein